MYETVCKDRFDTIEKHCETFDRYLRGKNGNPGLVDEVRALKASLRAASRVGIFVGGALLLNAIHYIWAWIGALGN